MSLEYVHIYNTTLQSKKHGNFEKASAKAWQYRPWGSSTSKPAFELSEVLLQNIQLWTSSTYKIGCRVMLEKFWLVGHQYPSHNVRCMYAVVWKLQIHCLIKKESPQPLGSLYYSPVLNISNALNKTNTVPKTKSCVSFIWFCNK